MSVAILHWSLLAAQIMLGLGMLATLYRMVAGPRAQDRILALDALYVVALLLLITLGIRTKSQVYFELAMLMGVTEPGDVAGLDIGSKHTVRRIDSTDGRPESVTNRHFDTIFRKADVVGERGSRRIFGAHGRNVRDHEGFKALSVTIATR